MGRNRIPEEEKKIRMSVSIKKKYLEKLKKKHPHNMSKQVEKLIKDYLKM